MPDARVLLLGDSLHLPYHPRVAEIVRPDGLTIVGPGKSTGDCSALVDAVDALLTEFNPDAACFACGPWDGGRLLADIAPEPVSMGRYQQDLQRLAEKFHRYCGNDVVFVTTLHIHPQRDGASLAARRRGVHAEQDGADLAHQVNHTLIQYNQLAMELLGQMNVFVTRLQTALGPYMDEAFRDDGTSLSDDGIQRAAKAVSDGIYGCL